VTPSTHKHQEVTGISIVCLASPARGKAEKFGIAQKSLDHNPAYEAETRLVVAQLPRSCPSNRRSTACNPNSNRWQHELQQTGMYEFGNSQGQATRVL
jgi:hypothetical protein